MIGTFGCLVLLSGTATHRLPVSWTEAPGFAMGVWRCDAWQRAELSIDLLNNLFFIRNTRR